MYIDAHLPSEDLGYQFYSTAALLFFCERDRTDKRRPIPTLPDPSAAVDCEGLCLSFGTGVSDALLTFDLADIEWLDLLRRSTVGLRGREVVSPDGPSSNAGCLALRAPLPSFDAPAPRFRLDVFLFPELTVLVMRLAPVWDRYLLPLALLVAVCSRSGSIPCAVESRSSRPEVGEDWTEPKARMRTGDGGEAEGESENAWLC
jgi:hypothetical protein